MLPKLGARDSALPPQPASGVRSVTFEYELSVWFEVLASSPQRTKAIAAGAQLPTGRIPLLIY